jgi:soluble lytic murein transglycosylase-like protein
VRPRKGRVPFQSGDILPHLIKQESGGRVGVSGPQTQYGRANGLTQVLPATAAGVAKKLGVPWRPDLMTGTSEAAANYQKAIGQGYLEEALTKTGNVSDALKYYHGGPNRRQWGPKTNAYADNILRRLGV